MFVKNIPMKHFVLLWMLCITTSFLSFSQIKPVDKNAILNAMNNQKNDWNEGNLKKYMAYYWNSDSLQFIGKSGVTYGWYATLEKYQKSYPDKATMGVLSFGDINITRLSRKHILVTGSWKLQRENDELKGYYSLIWEKIKGEWVIIVDHSS